MTGRGGGGNNENIATTDGRRLRNVGQGYVEQMGGQDT